MSRLLLVDDDVELCDMLAEYLGNEGFEVDMTHDGLSAVEKALSQQYDIIILDVMMPGINGFDVLRQLRPKLLTPVIMLTARGDDIDSIVGLELGADDYLPKPCNPRVLVARLRALLRRSPDMANPNEGKDQTLTLDAVTLHRGSRQALSDNKPLNLTSTEYSVLEVLMRQAGQIVSKQNLSQQALGRELSRYDRAIDMHVSSLRKKLGPNGPDLIQTIRGMGYLYAINGASPQGIDE